MINEITRFTATIMDVECNIVVQHDYVPQYSPEDVYTIQIEGSNGVLVAHIAYNFELSVQNALEKFVNETKKTIGFRLKGFSLIENLKIKSNENYSRATERK